MKAFHNFISATVVLGSLSLRTLPCCQLTLVDPSSPSPANTRGKVKVPPSAATAAIGGNWRQCWRQGLTICYGEELKVQLGANIVAAVAALYPLAAVSIWRRQLWRRWRHFSCDGSQAGGSLAAMYMSGCKSAVQATLLVEPKSKVEQSGHVHPVAPSEVVKGNVEMTMRECQQSGIEHICSTETNCRQLWRHFPFRGGNWRQSGGNGGIFTVPGHEQLARQAGAASPIIDVNPPTQSTTGPKRESGFKHANPIIDVNPPHPGMYSLSSTTGPKRVANPIINVNPPIQSVTGPKRETGFKRANPIIDVNPPVQSTTGPKREIAKGVAGLPV
ncbi:hypothetical protein C8R43DRAFT_949973 [Mycena crocata]|nr:hypothetical protein C8R43DRAFT_949973 [Mycena crocata]